MYTYEEALEHYGIKGMKWGVRRSEKELEKARKKNASEDVIKVKEAENKIRRGTVRKADLDRLSNDELKRVVDRMQLEQKYEQLANPEMVSLKKRGQREAENFAIDQAKKLASEGTQYAVSEALRRNIER